MFSFSGTWQKQLKDWQGCMPELLTLEKMHSILSSQRGMGSCHPNGIIAQEAKRSGLACGQYDQPVPTQHYFA
jgi:hypothetical protein